MRLLRHSILLLSLIVATTAVAATVRVDAPPRVEEGSSFQIVFSVSGANAGDCDINFPHQLGWANYLYGPARGESHSSSMTVINGKVSSSSSSSVTLTYTFRANKKGKFTIPSATIIVDGKAVKSQSRAIEVVEDNGMGGGYSMRPQSSSPVPSADPFTQTAGNRVTEKDAFVRVEMSKPKVYEQEAVVGSVKLYTRYPGQVQCTKLPQFDGFLIEEIPVDRQNPTPEVATVNGQKYYCFEMSRYLLYPQQSGKLTIAAGEYDIVVQQHDVYNALGMSVSIPVNTSIHVRSNAATVDITPLPEPRPAGFSGAVGNFSVTSTLTPEALKTYAPSTYSLIVNGTGNLKYIQAPAITFPKEFDSYDPQTNQSAANAGSNNMSGQMKFDYRIIPQFEGKYTIPAVKFVFFNTTSQRYETIEVPARTVTVAKGAGKPSSHYQLRNKDIEDIIRGDSELSKTHNHFVTSWLYWTLFALALILLLIFIPLYRKWERDHANDRLMRTRRASKVARKRLKTAQSLIAAANRNAFYTEVLNALWGYLSDKLNIQRSLLSKENITLEMEKYGFDENLRNRTIEMLDKCEFAQYAPELQSDDLNTVYDEVASLMDDLESVKRVKPDESKADMDNNKYAPIATAIALLLATWIGASATTADSLMAAADKAYDSHNYQRALELYNEALADYGSSAALYYNMGNTAYRLKDRAHAILYYERALKIDPSLRAARNNLQFIREKTQVDLANVATTGSWIDGIMSRLSTNGWATMALVAFVAALVAIAIVVASDRRRRKLIAFYSSIVLLLIAIASISCAIHLHNAQSSNKYAIIVGNNAHGHHSPHAATMTDHNDNDKEFALPDGMKVEIIDHIDEKTEDKSKPVLWYKIKTAEGAKAWVLATDLERI